MAAVKALGPGCFHLENALSPQEQIQLFRFLHARDATDWTSLRPCMNPTPKTLELLVTPTIPDKTTEQDAILEGETVATTDATARTVSIDPNEKNVVVELVEKVVDDIFASNSRSDCDDTSDATTPPPPFLHHPIQSISLSVIRYCIEGTSSTVGSILPPHVDHCNDGSWVFLFSLGCAASFFVHTTTTHPTGDQEDRRHEFAMKSGNVLVFDPSSKARILHGVTGVFLLDDLDDCGANENDRMTWWWKEERGDEFSVLRTSRFGVQCRMSFGL